jgi:hypothetical protein
VKAWRENEAIIRKRQYSIMAMASAMAAMASISALAKSQWPRNRYENWQRK